MRHAAAFIIFAALCTSALSQTVYRGPNNYRNTILPKWELAAAGTVNPSPEWWGAKGYHAETSEELAAWDAAQAALLAEQAAEQQAEKAARDAKKAAREQAKQSVGEAKNLKDLQAAILVYMESQP